MKPRGRLSSTMTPGCPTKISSVLRAKSKHQQIPPLKILIMSTRVDSSSVVVKNFREHFGHLIDETCGCHISAAKSRLFKICLGKRLTKGIYVSYL